MSTRDGLIVMMADADASYRPSREQFFMAETFGGATITHPGLPGGEIKCQKPDVLDLIDLGYLRPTHGSNVLFLDLTDSGFEEASRARLSGAMHRSESPPVTVMLAGQEVGEVETPADIEAVRDLDSNRTAIVENGTQVASYANSAGGLDQLSSVNTTAFGYTADGQVSSKGSNTLTWDGRGRLSGGTFSGQAVTYGFDATGFRRQRIGGGVTTNYLLGFYEKPPSGPLALSDVSGPAGDLAHYAGAPVVTQPVSYLYYSGHGDLAAEANTAGARTADYTYDPFGAPLQAPAANTTTERWTGRWDKKLDTTSSLIEMGARPYDPTLGRFLSVDPVDGGSLNSYDYALQDPINVCDLDGRAPRLSAQQMRNARIIFSLALGAGLSAGRAREMVAASYKESTLNAGARNRSSGAAGLFQLLSPGYVNRANAMGGVFNPRANTCAIMPSYVSYWRNHRRAAPGAGAAAVEASGEGASFYASPLKWLPRTFKKINVRACPRH